MRTTPTKRAGPKPRTIPRPAIKRCDRGHRQTWNWKGPACRQCIREDEHSRTPDGIEEERRRWAEELGPPPAELVSRTHDGVVTRHSIPKHLARRGRRR